MAVRNPRISIGLPVFNGTNYLSEALDSIIAQTYQNFELIIVDNASTDRTAAICCDYAALDRRILYYRNKTNLGAAANFNQVFYRAKGKYFKWMAHDDRISPTFLETTLHVLDKKPEIVLCYAGTEIINHKSDVIAIAPRYDGLAHKNPHRRFKAIVRNRPCYEVFGLIRCDVLKKTGLIGPYVASDRILLAELGLYGQFFQVPEILMQMRRHPDQSTQAMPALHQRGAWFDPALTGKLLWPRLRIIWEYLRSIGRASISARESALCYLQLASGLAYHMATMGYAWVGYDKGYNHQ